MTTFIDSTEDPRLARLAEICLALPETTRGAMGQHAKFLVRTKTFAYYLNDHHGDGIIALSCKAAPGINAMLTSSDPARFYLPAYLAPNGWMALRLDRGDIDWDEVTAFITDSYRLIAPKRLAALVSLPTDDPI
jgi:predicted DNA-binding protein (MmcQ/YjbR family)